MHLTCTNMDTSIIDETLNNCKQNNIKNILALRGELNKILHIHVVVYSLMIIFIYIIHIQGDPPAGQEWKKIKGG